MDYKMTKGDLTDPRVVAFLQHHFTTARAQTAEGSAHALDLSGLRRPDIDFWTLWDSDELLATGALKTHSAVLGEVKSMHTVSRRRRSGVASAMLSQIIAEAKGKGLAKLSLETGSWDYFKPAVALYANHGFVVCEPFADYQSDPNSVFMTLALR